MGFQVKLGLVRGRYLPAGLHAAEASYVSSSSISSCRAAIVRAVWSTKMPLANTPAILNLLDGPVDVDPAFHVIWSRFRMMRRFLAYCPEEEPRIFSLGVLRVMGLFMFFLSLLLSKDGDEHGWVRVSLPPLRMMAGPIQHFRSAILEAWHFHVFGKLSERKRFWCVEFADLKGSLQLLTSTHLRERDKMLLRAILCGRVWNRFLLGKARKEDVPCRFCGNRDGDGHLFWECSFHPRQHVRELPEFAFLMSLDRSKWPRCLLWHGWLSGLNGISLKDLWATSFLVIQQLFILKGTLVLILLILLVPGLLLIIGMLLILPWRCLSTLMSGLMVVERISPLLVALKLLVLLFICMPLSLRLMVWFGKQQRSMAMLVWGVAVLFCLFPVFFRQFSVLNSGVLFLLCRLTGLVIWVLTTLMLLGVLVACLIMVTLISLCPLVKDGDLIASVQYMVRTRGRETVRVTKVKGHAEDFDVLQGRVRLIDQQGNAEADTAADLGRRHQSEMLINARRRLLQARSYWYPIMFDLHRFMIAVAQVSVNHDGKGGIAPDPLVWDQWSRPKVRKLGIRVNVDLASLPGPSWFPE